MKQLNTYLEGLLDKSSKTSTDSAIASLVGEYIEKCIVEDKISEDVTYTISGKAITFANILNGEKYKCKINVDDIDELVHKYGIKKIILQGYWLLYGGGTSYDLPIVIECNRGLTIRPSYGERKISTIKNINIKTTELIVQDKIKLSNTQIQTDVVTILRPNQLIRCKVQTNYIITYPLESEQVGNLVRIMKGSLIKHTGGYVIKDLGVENPDIINELKDINPSIALGFDKYNIDTIVIKNVYNHKNKDILVFTKNPKSHTLKYPVIYEMKNDWYAIWTPYDESLLKQKNIV